MKQLISLLKHCNARDKLIVKLLAMLALTPEQICFLCAGNYDATTQSLFVPLVNRPDVSAWVFLPKRFDREIKNWMGNKTNSEFFFPGLTELQIFQMIKNLGAQEGFELQPDDLRALLVDHLLAVAEFARFSGPIEARIKSVDIYNDDRDSFVSREALRIENMIEIAEGM